MTLIEKLIIAGVLALVLLGAAWKAVDEIEQRGYDRRAEEDRVAMEHQRQENRDLQRAAELRYTVKAETRDRFITQTVTEIRHDTENLAACRLTPAAVQRLRGAAECAGEDRPASCGPVEPVREPAATP